MASLFSEKQKQAFRAGLSEVASRIAAPSNKRPAPASPSPSVASNASAAPGGTPTKKARTDAGVVIYSQPENTGRGVEIGTQMVYAVQKLKDDAKPLSLDYILGFLNLNREAEATRREVADRLRSHPRVAFIPDPKNGDWTAGTYEHKPILPGVRDKTSLLRYLQQRPDASGVMVKDIKDGWPGCEAAISELEGEHKVLVVRTKKDNHPRMVWIDDPTLAHRVDDEFRAKWLKVVVPDVNDIVGKLKDVGQKPTSDDPRLLQTVTTEKPKKKRAQRRSGKVTNHHMAHMLKDYDDEISKR